MNKVLEKYRGEGVTFGRVWMGLSTQGMIPKGCHVSQGGLIVISNLQIKSAS